MKHPLFYLGYLLGWLIVNPVREGITQAMLDGFSPGHATSPPQWAQENAVAQPCCAQWETCQRPCTPRGAWEAEQRFKKLQ